MKVVTQAEVENKWSYASIFPYVYTPYVENNFTSIFLWYMLKKTWHFKETVIRTSKIIYVLHFTSLLKFFFQSALLKNSNNNNNNNN